MSFLGSIRFGVPEDLEFSDQRIGEIHFDPNMAQFPGDEPRAENIELSWLMEVFQFPM